MDRFDAMRLFVRIVERRSFTLAAQDIGVPRSTATSVIKQMEERLGVNLLQRTTRTVNPTLDGEAYYRRCIAILADVEEAEGAMSATVPKGVLRIDVQGTLARHFLMPGLQDFFAHYPDIELSMSERDQWIDPVHEGVDCVLRFGELADSNLIARRVATLKRLTCASPEYLARFGKPGSIDDLDGHQIVGMRSLTTGNLRTLDFMVDGNIRQVSVPEKLSVTGPESYRLGLILGFGIAQVPHFHVADDLAQGRLVELFADTPPPPAPVSLLFPRSHQLSPRVRVFIDWAVREFRKRD